MASPLPLAFDENDAPIVAAQVSVGFVNPYSKHPEEAREFLALILKNMRDTSAATLFTDKTEPVRETRNDDWVESNKQWVESIEKMLEEAEEGQEKADLEENLKEAKAQLEYSERWMWRVSPDDLANYQKILPNLKVMDYLFLYDMFNSEDEESTYALAGMFYGEDPDPEQMLDMIDKKIQTIRKEGN
jgi:ABC-type glycerol-3-phosphate transport system substrate-binding protein